MQALTDSQVVELAHARITDYAAGDIHSDLSQELIETANDLVVEFHQGKLDAETIAILRAVMDTSVTGAG